MNEIVCSLKLEFLSIIIFKISCSKGKKSLENESEVIEIRSIPKTKIQTTQNKDVK